MKILDAYKSRGRITPVGKKGIKSRWDAQRPTPKPTPDYNKACSTVKNSKKEI